MKRVLALMRSHRPANGPERLQKALVDLIGELPSALVARAQEADQQRTLWAASAGHSSDCTAS